MEFVSYWHWLIVAVVLIGVGALWSRMPLLLCGLAALLVAAILFFVPGLGWLYQCMVSLVTAVVSIALRKHYA